MADVSTFEFARQMLAQTTREEVQHAQLVEAVVESSRAPLEDYLRNLVSKGTESAVSAYKSIKYVVKRAHSSLLAVGDRGDRTKIIMLVLGALATSVGPGFPAIA